MKVILSIKPQFADKIFEGTKKYEFRKSIFKNPKVKKVVVYSSSPVQKIIGEFEIENILVHDLETLWNMTKTYAGISEDYFFEYFNKRDHGYAIKVKATKLYKRPKCIRQDYNLIPPQSFLYLI